MSSKIIRISEGKTANYEVWGTFIDSEWAKSRLKIPRIARTACNILKFLRNVKKESLLDVHCIARKRRGGMRLRMQREDLSFSYFSSTRKFWKANSQFYWLMTSDLLLFIFNFSCEAFTLCFISALLCICKFPFLLFHSLMHMLIIKTFIPEVINTRYKQNT